MTSSTPPASQASATATSTPAKRGSSLRYLALLGGLTVVGLGGVWKGNQMFAPEMYSRSGTDKIAEALAKGQNYALFDLNINIRDIRDAQIARMKEAPELVILGASHWQEAHVDLLPGRRVYNAHIHRDYWEDPLGMVEMFVRHDKLPRHMIIAVRDNQFTPVAQRKDYLWLPGIPYYRAMAARLKLKPHGTMETLPVQRWKELASISMLYSNAARWYKAPVKPHATAKAELEDMDLLLPGGSIVWSSEHQRLFSPQRAEKLASAFAEANRTMPPKVDPKGVEAFDALLSFLKSRNVNVVLAHPPFNPDYFDAIQNTPYIAGMRRVEELTKELAAKHGLSIIGSFDPRKVGCEDSDYIDAEHANAECLGKLLKQFETILPVAQAPAAPAPVAAAAPAVAPAAPAAPAAVAAAAPAALVPLAAKAAQSAGEAKAEPKPQAKVQPAQASLTRRAAVVPQSAPAGAGARQKPAAAAPVQAKGKPKAAAPLAAAAQPKAKAVDCKAPQVAKSKACTQAASARKAAR